MIRVECREWTDDQIGNNDSANDVRDVDLTHAHMLSGPIAVEGAEPGDLLVVDILDLGPVPQEAATRPAGLGLHRHLRQGERRRLPHRPVPRRLQGDLGLLRPEVHLAAHPGGPVHRHHPPGPVRHRAVAGAAGAVERPRAGADRHRSRTGSRRWRCRRWRKRAGRHGNRRRPGQRSAATAPGPCPPGRTAGTTTSRTSPAVRGCSIPVHVPGALFSGGDLHFSQGDGEITFCGAIEMGGFIDFHVDLIKGGMETYGVTTNPILMPGNVEPRYCEFITFIGIGVDHDTDTQLYNDATVAYRNACLNAVDVPEEVRLLRARRRICCSAPRRSRAGSAASSTSRTRAARSTCRRRSSTSTSGRRHPDPSRPTAGAARSRRNETASRIPCPAERVALLDESLISASEVGVRPLGPTIR